VRPVLFASGLNRGVIRLPACPLDPHGSNGRQTSLQDSCGLRKIEPQILPIAYEGCVRLTALMLPEHGSTGWRWCLQYGLKARVKGVGDLPLAARFVDDSSSGSDVLESRNEEAVAQRSHNPQKGAVAGG
jgi:hypothetical protein